MSGTIICYGDSNTYGYDSMCDGRRPLSRRRPLDRNSGEGNRLEDRGSRNPAEDVFRIQEVRFDLPVNS